MKTLTNEQIEIEWKKFSTIFEKLGLTSYYDMEKLYEEITTSPCSLNEDMGNAYKGALLIHINMIMALSQRIAKMISGTFSIDELSLIKCCAIMHLSKRFLYVENKDEWSKNRGVAFKFANNLEGCLKCGERSALEALNNGVKLTPIEYECITILDDDSNILYKSIMTIIVKQANELAYSIQKEKYNKIIKQNESIN